MSMLRIAGVMLAAGLPGAMAGSSVDPERTTQTRAGSGPSLQEAWRAFEQHRFLAYPPEDPRNVTTLKLLNQNVDFIEFNQKPAEEALRELAREYHLNLHVDWPELDYEDALRQLRRKNLQSITVYWSDPDFFEHRRTHPVTLQLRNVPLAAVVNTILTDIDPWDTVVSGVHEGVLRVTSSDTADLLTYTRFYNCRELVNVPLDPEHRRVLARVLSELSAEDRRMSTSKADDEALAIREYEHLLSLVLNRTEREERVENLLDIIREAIEPDSWRRNGGDLASIAEYRGVLIVTHTAPVHRRLETFLNELRRTLAGRQSR